MGNDDIHDESLFNLQGIGTHSFIENSSNIKDCTKTKNTLYVA